MAVIPRPSVSSDPPSSVREKRDCENAKVVFCDILEHAPLIFSMATDWRKRTFCEVSGVDLFGLGLIYHRLLLAGSPCCSTGLCTADCEGQMQKHPKVSRLYFKIFGFVNSLTGLSPERPRDTFEPNTCKQIGT